MNRVLLMVFALCSFLGLFGILQLNWLGPRLHAQEEIEEEAQAEVAKEFAELETFNEDFDRIQSVLRSIPKRILPSVVQLNIFALKDDPVSPNFLFDFFDDKDKQKAPEKINPHKYRSSVMGSGVIFRQEGQTFFLVTNNHVIQDARDIEIISYRKHKFAGKVVGHDDRVDLAVLSFEADKTQAEDLKVARLGDSQNLEIGDWVMAVGSPNGFQSSVTMGIVSYIGRHGGPVENINDFIQTDAAINHGNSGGPLVNMYGEVIGINTWLASESGSSAGLGFAIPINNTKYIIESFLKEGKVRYGWLGIVMQEYGRILNRIGPHIERFVLGDYGVYDKKGAFITSVFEGSPADKAGIKPGDFVTAVNGKNIENTEELTFAIGLILPGQQAQLRIFRDGESSEYLVTLGERKDGELLDSESHRTWPGIDVIPLDDRVVKALKELSPGLKVGDADDEIAGLWVFRIIPQSTSDIMGLQQNDIITAINGEEVFNLRDFYRILNEIGRDGEIVYSYERQGEKGQTAKIES